MEKTQATLDYERRATKTRDALSGVLPGAAWSTNAEGKEVLKVGGINIYIDGLVDRIIWALDDEFAA